jgi:hypothetical protein
MPLSEDEQRILREIEQQFYESDPTFAQSVSQASLYRHALSRVKWGTVMLVLGLVFLVATLQVHFAVAFIGFLIMLVGAFFIEKNVRTMGRAGMQQVTSSWRGGRLRETGDKMKSKFKRPES